MIKITWIKNIIVTSLIVLATSCSDEPLEGRRDVVCQGCAEIPPGGGTIGFPPTIGSFSPLKGFAGTIVTITGSKFSATALHNFVRFDGVLAEVISATTTKLIVRVPSGATSGKITATVSGLTGTSATDFQVLDIPLNGLVAFYPFDGNADDIGPHQLNGTVSGAVLTADRFGNANSAYRFAAGGPNINAGNPQQLQISGTITLAAWVKVTDNVYGTQRIINKINPKTGSLDYVLHKVKDGYVGSQMKIYTRNPNPAACNYKYDNGIDFHSTEWAFVAVAVNNTHLRLYINGELAGYITDICPMVDSGQTNFVIGGQAVSTREIDEVAVYNRSLSDEEVMQLYQQNILL